MPRKLKENSIASFREVFVILTSFEEEREHIT